MFKSQHYKSKDYSKSVRSCDINSVEKILRNPQAVEVNDPSLWEKRKCEDECEKTSV